MVLIPTTPGTPEVAASSAPRLRRFKPRKERRETFKVTEGLGVDEVDAARSWLNAQIPYDNLAQHKDVAERVVHFAREHESHYLQSTEKIRNTWRVLNHILNGNTTGSVWGLEDIHVPEIYKLLETIVPRIEEAVRQYDPWFTVVGRRGGVDKERANLIASFLQFQLGQMRDDDDVQPAIRDMLIYQFCMEKIWWETTEEWAIERVVQKNTDSKGRITWTITREEKKRVTYNAPQSALVDPFDAILDIRRVEPDQMMLIGDNTWMSYDELEMMQDRGVFTNVEQLRDVRPSSQDRVSAAEVGNDKLSRSLVRQFAHPQQDPEGTPRMFRVREIWGRSTILGDEREMLFTVVEDKVCVRAQENFHDDKHRPYAIGRSAREGHEFFRRGIFDNAIPIQEQLDIHRALLLEGSKNASSPPLVTDEETDLPDSLYGLGPGRVWDGIRGKADFLRIPDVQQSAVYIQDMLRRDLEEIVGAPRIFEGTGAGGATATETVRKIEEGNRRLRGVIRAYTAFEERKLRIMHALNGQFLTRTEAFRVLGKQGKHVTSMEIGPDAFQDEIDFTFKGTANLHTLGTRASAILQLMTAIAPYANMYPGQIDVLKMLSRLEHLTVGTFDGDEIVRVPKELDSLMHPIEENALLLSGQRVQVEEEDGHEDHLPDHFKAMEQAEKDGNEVAMIAILQHIVDHSARLAQEEARQSSISQRQPLNLPPQMDANVEPTPGGDLGFGGGVEATPTGENPGTDDPAKVAKPGRNSPANQDGNHFSNG